MIMDPRQKYTIPSLRNGCRVLKHLAKFPEGLDLKSISSALGIPRTTALRICTTLELENLLLRTGDGKYILGSGLAPLGMLALPNASIRKMAVPILSDMVEETHETAHLALLCGKESLILEVCDSPHHLRVASRPGSLLRRQRASRRATGSSPRSSSSPCSPGSPSCRSTGFTSSYFRRPRQRSRSSERSWRWPGTW